MNNFIKNNSLLIRKSNTGISPLDYYYIPTENEWYKAAFYSPILNGYWDYPTQSDTAPTPVSANSIGDGSAGDSGNFANWNNGADWNGLDGNFTTVGTNGGPSYYGCFDMGGNIIEYNELIDIFNIDGTTYLFRGIRGGSQSGPPINPIDRLSSNPEFKSHPSNGNGGIGFRICTIHNSLNLPNFVSVDNAGNSNDNNGYGSVNYIYQINKYEITNDQYISFLNSIAITDYYGLYDTRMNSNLRGGIIRVGTNGAYSYSAKTNMGNKPVNFVSWINAARYCNWLTNRKPTGLQNLNTTEDGAYYINGIMNTPNNNITSAGGTVVRKS